MKRGYYLAVLLAFSLLCSFCAQQTDGCIDFRATTVDVNADNPCDECCQYPNLELQFIPVRDVSQVDFQVLRSSDTLFLGTDTALNPQLSFFIHDINLVTVDDELVPLLETYTIVNDDRSESIFETSVFRVRPFRQTRGYEAGQLLNANTFVGIEAKVGLPEALRSIDPSLQMTNGPFSYDSDTLMRLPDQQSLADAAVKFEDLGAVADSVYLSESQNEIIRWSFAQELDYQPSFNVLVTLVLPVDNLLNFKNQAFITESEWRTGFLEDFRIVEVEMSR